MLWWFLGIKNVGAVCVVAIHKLTYSTLKYLVFPNASFEILKALFGLLFFIIMMVTTAESIGLQI